MRIRASWLRCSTCWRSLVARAPFVSSASSSWPAGDPDRSDTGALEPADCRAFAGFSRGHVACRVRAREACGPRRDRVALRGADEDLKAVAGEAPAPQVAIHVETDLPPAAYLCLLDRLPTQRIGVTYDIGNSASLGYDPSEELRAYGDRVGSVHVKDRLRGGA